ncbi:MAG TPA: DJ-1/PfpI family protein [Pyrinomonadaceae bacterium]|jgi:cyclohexyl-isocyanide hydratase
MPKKTSAFHIIIPIYEQVNLFDVTSACEMFYWMGYFWKERKVTINLVEAKGRVVKTHAGPKLTPDRSFAYYNGKKAGRPKRQAQLIWVPGADDTTTRKMMGDADYINFLRQQAPGAEYVTSVCEGAMLLANAGLLDGYEATTHWSMIPCLSTIKGVTVVPDYPRYKVDGNRVTGGGVSSGIDESLKLIQLIANDDIAEQVQVVTQYFPEPPVQGTIPASTCDIKLPPPPPPPPGGRRAKKR